MRKLLVSNKKYSLFLVAVIFSNAGDYIDDIAFAQLVYLITKSTLFSSYVFAVKIIFSIFSIFSATLADKFNKKLMIITSCILQGSLIICLLITYQSGNLTTLLLFCFVTVQALFSSFCKPAQNAILPLIVEKNELVTARSLMAITNQFIQIIAYISSAALIYKIGIKGALMVDAISFVMMAIVFGLIKLKETIIPIRSINDFWQNVKEGFSFIKYKRVIFTIMLLTFGGNFLATPIDLLMPAYTSQMHYPKTYFPFFMMIVAIGGVIGGGVVTKIQKKVPNGVLFSFGYLFGAVCMMALSIRAKAFFIAAAFFMGMSISIVSILNASMIQMLTPKEMTARVFAIFKCISFTASPLGMVIAGMLGEYMIMKWVYLIYGIAMLFLTFISFMYCKIE